MLNLTESEEKIYNEWMLGYAKFLGFIFLSESAKTQDYVEAAERMLDSHYEKLVKVLGGKYPLEGRLPSCTKESCEGSSYNGVFCNVSSETVRIVRKAWRSVADEDTLSAIASASMLYNMLGEGMGYDSN